MNKSPASFSVVMIMVFLTSGCEKKVQKLEEMPTEAQTSLGDSTTITTSENLITLGDPETSSTGDAYSQGSRMVVQTGVSGAVGTNAVPVSSSAMEESAASLSDETPTVAEIQQALNNAGLYDGKVDGSLGPKTKKAIKDFQFQNQLSVDGKVGPRTWQRLQSYLNNQQNTAAVSPSY